MTGTPYNPYFDAPTPMHGGNFDPNQIRSGGQLSSANPSGTRASGQPHGGDFDPNAFRADRRHEQGQGQRSGSLLMGSNAVQGQSDTRNGSESSNHIYSSNSPGDFLSPDSIPMESLQHGTGNSSRREGSPESLRALLHSTSGHDPATALPSSNSKSHPTNPNGLSGAHKPDNKKYYHRDILKRHYYGRRDDRFLNPKDGRPCRLVTQCSEAVRSNRSEATWTRTHVRDKTSFLFPVKRWATGQYAPITYIPACVVLSLITFNPFPITATTRNNGMFEPFPYKDWQYPYDARNNFENRPRGGTNRSPHSRMNQSSQGQPLIGKIERISEPDYLCLESDMETIHVSQWRDKHGKDAKLEYVFISYTSSQFQSVEDILYLHRVGQHAARSAGVNAYWLGCSCLGATKAEQEQNVWRICDVVRGAFSLVIVVADSASLTATQTEPHDPLRQWGTRVWTLPELLLSPEQDDIMVYTTGPDLELREPDQHNRRNFPRLWDDYNAVGQLIDHYESSVILSPLELMTTALHCLQNRQTQQYLDGDLSYALMGLLRQRPNVRPSDSAFQAFARLSLANDSNLLLERLICLLPTSAYEPWHSLQDHWGASLWDIYPKTQVCGIGENDSVVLDGARAASIRWKSFARVISRGNDTVMRTLARFALSLHGYLLIFGIFFLVYSKHFDLGEYANTLQTKYFHTFKIIGGVFIALFATVCLSLPPLIELLYLGKVWSAQPWFFGVEGYMSLPDLERHVFGEDRGRLSWSATGSSLSRHEVEDSKEHENFCEGQDPSRYPDIDARIQKALTSSSDGEKIFMLVDTHTLTVTLFSAIKPPVAVVMCGEEGGMQRALLCSYEWTNNTLYRETVLRMETRTYWRMSTVGRIRLSLQTRRNLDV
ncbi:hypothetical protein MMC07_003664 [Pseudocyphellaria aurata]|nr:hypothetical protein [Pseudocyphellaria aurata]